MARKKKETIEGIVNTETVKRDKVGAKVPATKRPIEQYPPMEKKQEEPVKKEENKITKPTNNTKFQSRNFGYYWNGVEMD